MRATMFAKTLDAITGLGLDRLPAPGREFADGAPGRGTAALA
jgi:hypothetical protein